MIQAEGVLRGRANRVDRADHDRKPLSRIGPHAAGVTGGVPQTAAPTLASLLHAGLNEAPVRLSHPAGAPAAEQCSWQQGSAVGQGRGRWRAGLGAGRRPQEPKRICRGARREGAAEPGPGCVGHCCARACCACCACCCARLGRSMRHSGLAPRQTRAKHGSDQTRGHVKLSTQKVWVPAHQQHSAAQQAHCHPGRCKSSSQAMLQTGEGGFPQRAAHSFAARPRAVRAAL